MNFLVVIYHETEAHFNMMVNTLKSFPEGSEITAVVNKRLEGAQYPEGINYIENDINCLGRAWNIGIREIFKTQNIAFVSNLDIVAPEPGALVFIQHALEQDPSIGVVGATPHRFGENKPISVEPRLLNHGDGSFSFFAIHKDAFEKVGGFSEEYLPCYFEDNDMLERLKKFRFKPMQFANITYHHVTQGTVKHGTDSKTQYPEYMQRNLEKFKEMWGFVPPHLPQDINFLTK